MPRYVSRKPRADYDDWYEPPLTPDLTVIEREPAPTGLLDSEGNEIWRLPDPIGFLWHE